MRTPFASHEEEWEPHLEWHQDPYTALWYFKGVVAPFWTAPILSPLIERYTPEDVVYRLPLDRALEELAQGRRVSMGEAVAVALRGAKK